MHWKKLNKRIYKEIVLYSRKYLEIIGEYELVKIGGGSK